MKKQKTKKKQQKNEKIEIEYKKEEEKLPKFFSLKSDKLLLEVSIKPNSKENKIQLLPQEKPEEIEIWIAAPPKENEANKELIRQLSDICNISSSKINIEKGTKSKNKLISFDISMPSEIEKIYDILKKNSK